MALLQPQRQTYFNPRSPHGERQPTTQSKTTTVRFQSTLPARGATQIVVTVNLFFYFNPRSPHGERPAAATASSALENFNPRSPHGERHLPLTGLQ